MCEPIPIVSVDTSDDLFSASVAPLIMQLRSIVRSPTPRAQRRATRGDEVAPWCRASSSCRRSGDSPPHHLCPTQHNIACESEQWPAASPAFSCAATAHISDRTSPSDPHGNGTSVHAQVTPNAPRRRPSWGAHQRRFNDQSGNGDGAAGPIRVLLRVGDPCRQLSANRVASMREYGRLQIRGSL